jgi:flagellar protein FliO/FliZ
MFLAIDSAGRLPDQISALSQFLTVIIIFILVVGLSIFATKWIANYQKGASVAGNIEVIETFRLATNKFVQIVRIGDQYLAIAIGKDEVTLLTELSFEELKQKTANTNVMPDFASVLAKFKKSPPATPPEE